MEIRRNREVSCLSKRGGKKEGISHSEGGRRDSIARPERIRKGRRESNRLPARKRGRRGLTTEAVFARNK